MMSIKTETVDMTKMFKMNGWDLNMTSDTFGSFITPDVLFIGEIYSSPVTVYRESEGATTHVFKIK